MKVRSRLLRGCVMSLVVVFIQMVSFSQFKESAVVLWNKTDKDIVVSITTPDKYVGRRGYPEKELVRTIPAGKKAFVLPGSFVKLDDDAPEGAKIFEDRRQTLKKGRVRGNISEIGTSATIQPIRTDRSHSYYIATEGE